MLLTHITLYRTWHSLRLLHHLLEPHNPSDYLNHKFGTTFKTKLYGGTLDWYNEGSRLKEITKEMTVMEHLRNLILDVNEAHKLIPHAQSKVGLIRSRRSSKWVIFQGRSVILRVIRSTQLLIYLEKVPITKCSIFKQIHF